MYPYIILSCGYMQYHAGIRALFILCDKLNKAGAEAYMFANGQMPRMQAPDLNNDRQKLSELIAAGAIVVYPEIFSDNILGAKRPVSWMLNNKAVNIGERFFYHTNMAGAKAERMLTIDVIEHDLFNTDNNYERVHNTAWIGKGRVDDRLYEIPDLKIITNQIPSDRAELAIWLKQSKAFYTFDAMTALIGEAALCGTPVVYLRNGSNTAMSEETTLRISRNGYACGFGALKRAEKTVSKYAADYKAYFGNGDEHVRNFINITQSMEEL